MGMTARQLLARRARRSGVYFRGPAFTGRGRGAEDFPRQERPPGGFVRPMFTCRRCWQTSPAFYVRNWHRCPACWAYVSPRGEEAAP